MKLHRPFHLVIVLALGGCGGTVVFEGDGAGDSTSGSTEGGAAGSPSGNGGGPATSGSNGSVASVTSTASGAGGCTSHQDCAPDLCIFLTGACAPACDGESCDACGPFSVCDDCATSACAECQDCRSACLPLQPGRCDDDDPCPEDGLCDFGDNRCRAGCTPDGACVDPSDVCAPCEGSSCCGCDDCVGGCIPPRD